MATVSGLSGNMPEVKKSSPWLIYLIVLLVLGGLVYGVYAFVKGNSDNGADKEEETVTELDNDDEEEQTEEEPEDETEEEVEDEPTDEEEETEDDTVDLSNFSEEKQSIGASDNDAEYTLRTVSNSPESDQFHRFTFTLMSAETDDDPYVVVTYKSSLGAINVDLNGTTKDESGLGYQKSININRNGVVRLYHNVSSDQTEELYDIGVSESTPFYLHVEQTADNASAQAAVWVVTVDVQYPGESEVESDFGSEEFSDSVQTIDGANKADGAKVSSYSYNTSSGVLSMVFTVSGSSAKPIPSATVGYDGSADLVLRFTSVVSDAIAKTNPSVSLPGGITMTAEMEDSDTSVYYFEGTDGDFKLSGTTNPNQVVLEIKL
jgi:hypothetical protein